MTTPDLTSPLKSPLPATPPLSRTPLTPVTPTASVAPMTPATPTTALAPPVPATPATPTAPATAASPAAPTVPATPAAQGTEPLPAVPPTPASGSAPAGTFTPNAAREDVPVLHRTVNGHPLVWLDNAATTQKPRQVIEALGTYYSSANSNIHRGAHTMAREATEAYEAARAKVAEFLGAPSPDGVIFVRGTTEAVNLVAQSWGRTHLGPGDDILVPVLEHHSDIVPWQQIAAERRARVVPVPLLPDGTIDQNAYADLLSHRTQLVAISHASNVLGTISPVREMTALAHRYGARVLVDGAQAVAHLPVDVTALDADFYAFSGHKIFGPTGIGALWAKPEVLATMQPWQGGGNMIESVEFGRTVFAPAPHRFEAGTGHIGGAVGLLAALEWFSGFGREAVAAYETALTRYAMAALGAVPGLEVLGPVAERVGVLTFSLPGHTPADVASRLDGEGIAVRAGHHCAQPALRHYGLDSATRASLALYNTPEDVDRLVSSLLGLTQQEPAA
ncbi:SufS family cysteine desulfurase [Streptomyces iconiensis]|uniref:cysteine desulfurase n=1 Tax=Streptomyces iconiensis TaxID=1384038 RepID=A0ABT7A6U5_9ACTN|nr:SufS family cysteine desulfurase [Streptomyces iconiensis]MDJ1137057.1 SufS family cysteine desulfurase [Streptomyces iconiensis]